MDYIRNLCRYEWLFDRGMDVVPMNITHISADRAWKFVNIFKVSRTQQI